MSSYRYVILGGGLAAGYAAQAYADVGGVQGELQIISVEEIVPYERPPLSKDFLAGDESVDEILINAPDFYREHGIDVRLGTRVDRVDLQEKVLHAGDERFGFEKLLIATGSHLRRLDVPGTDLENVFYLRRIGQSRAIRAAAEEAQQAVVVGGSFIGMEVASVLQSSGVTTTMVFPESRVWEAFFTPRMSEFFENYYRDRGVHFVKNAEIARLMGNGRVNHVELGSGQTLSADLVVLGIGVEPNIDIFRDTGLELNNGILVNRFLETNFPGVFAAGDVARYHDTLFDTQRRVEHWDNAYSQGRHAMQVMLGRYEPYVHVPYFFSDVFDLSYEFWGDTQNHNEVVHRGEVESGSFSVWWLKNGRLRAAFIINRPDSERELAQTWIERGEPLEADALADAKTPLRPAETAAVA